MSVNKSDLEIDELEIACKRARYRAWHRGTKELDFILGRFCDAHIDGFTAAEMKLFEQTMENEETSLQAWLMGQAPIPDGEEAQLLRQIRDFHLAFDKENGGKR